MLKIYPSIHRVYNIIHVCLVYYQKGVEDWFGCGKLNVLMLYFLLHVSVLAENINNGQTTITTAINNIESHTREIEGYI